VALARGDFETAVVGSRAADLFFPVYWLSVAFVALQFAIEVNLDEASRRYHDLAVRTENPDVIDAYATVLLEQGRKADASEWIARSRRIWNERMRLLPEAAATHFAEHLYKFGDQQAALDLAALEYRRRPTSASAVNLATILVAQGQPERGLKILTEAEGRGWKTAKMKFEAALALEALGRMGESQATLKSAQALNPHIAEPRQRFISFEQD
jgi:tetratricopeptide (TPR) repeat protein